jgi:hypothetical protein
MHPTKCEGRAVVTPARPSEFVCHHHNGNRNNGAGNIVRPRVSRKFSGRRSTAIKERRRHVSASPAY